MDHKQGRVHNKDDGPSLKQTLVIPLFVRSKKILHIIYLSSKIEMKNEQGGILVDIKQKLKK